MSRLIVCSEADLPSVNMRRELLAMRRWEDAGSSGGATFLTSGDDVLMSVPDMHIRHDGLDAEAEAAGFHVDLAIIMSRHSSGSGKPALTAHPIGNLHDAEYGGRPKELVKAAPAAMSDALRRIAALNRDPAAEVSFEATHHGPWLDSPTFFIEIGSDETYWADEGAARTLARAICEATPRDGYPAVVGLGGGHYAPRFTDVALGFEADFGHIVPSYQTDGRDDEDVERMVRDACAASGTRLVYIHRNAMRGAEYRRISEIVRSAGFETASSKDFEPLGGSPRRSPRTAPRGSPRAGPRGSCR